MINWRSGKAGFVGASKRLIKGFFSYQYSVTTATVVTRPVFSGTVPNVTISVGDPDEVIDFSTYFAGATSYSIVPSEVTWAFNTSTGLLTIPSNYGLYGYFVVYAHNASGDANTNAFTVSVTFTGEATPSGNHRDLTLTDKNRDTITTEKNRVLSVTNTNRKLN